MHATLEQTMKHNAEAKSSLSIKQSYGRLKTAPTHIKQKESSKFLILVNKGRALVDDRPRSIQHSYFFLALCDCLGTITYQ